MLDIHEEHLKLVKKTFSDKEFKELFFLKYAVKERELLKLREGYELEVLPLEDRELYYDGWMVWEFSDVLEGEGEKRLGIPTLPRPQFYDAPIAPLFLDRDGILTVDNGYVKSMKDTKIVDGVIEFLQEMKAKGFSFFVLTNQSGVAREFFKMDDVNQFHLDLSEQLDKHGIKIERFETCPYHFESESFGKNHFIKHSYLRKPWPGMIYQIAKDYYLDINKMIMIGDRPSDQLQLTGLKTYLLKGKYPIDKAFSNISFDSYQQILSKINSCQN